MSQITPVEWIVFFGFLSILAWFLVWALCYSGDTRHRRYTDYAPPEESDEVPLKDGR